MAIKFTNNATSTLASGIASGDVSLTVSTGQGALFPTLGGGDYFYCTLSNVTNTIEIVKVTARSTDTFTIVRAQDNTTASAFITGDKVELRLVSAVLSNTAILDQTNVFSAAQTVNINGTVGATTANSGVFTTLTASTSATLSPSGVVTINPTTAGTINNMSVGATTASTGTFTTLTATADSAFTSTGALTISKGNTAARPTATSGMLRFNTQTVEFEGYNGTAWASVGGASLSNDTSTASNLFPLFANATSGTASTLFTGNAKLLYKPSTGELKVDVPVAGNGIMVNSTTVATSYTIASGNNGFSVGPITVASGQAVTVSSGQRWLVL